MTRILILLLAIVFVCRGQNDPFTTHVNVTAGDGTGSLTVADFNKDGKVDIAVMNPAANTITILFGDGKGEFTAVPGGPLHFNTAEGVSEPLAAGDFNGDGKIDLVFTEHTDIFSSATTRLIVRFGKGDGTFLPAPLGTTVLNSPYFFDRLEAVDLNQDGKLDVVGNVPSALLRQATGTRLFAGLLYVGDGLGAFGSSEVQASTAVGDFNQDGRLDYVRGQNSGATVWLAQGSGTYVSAISGGLNGGISQIEMVDYDHDGALDAVVSTINSSTSNTDSVYGLRGVGTGTLVNEFQFTVGRIIALRAGDFNGDGVSDIAVLQDNSLRVALLRSPTALVAPYSFDYSTGPNVADIRAADFDGDEKPDLVVSTGSDLLLLLTGPDARASQTITFQSIPDRTVNSAALAPTVSASSGLSVIISSNSPSVCSATANVITLIAGGTCSLRADQPGNVATKAALPVYRSFNVSFLPQSITVAPFGPVTFGSAPVQVQAIASSGLPLTFYGGHPEGVCVANGAMLTLRRVGTCQLTVSQSGNGIYAATSVTVSIEVLPLSQGEHSINFPALPDAPLSQTSIQIPSPISTWGYSASLTSNTPEVCSVSVGVPVFFIGTLNAGTCSLTASLVPAYPVATPVTRTFNILLIAKQSQTIGSANISNSSLAQNSVAAGFLASSGLTVVVTSNTPSVCSYFGSVIRLLTVGTCSMTATQAGNAFYLPVSRTVTFDIIGSPTQSASIIFPAIPDMPLGVPVFHVYASSNAGTASLVSNTPSVCSVNSGMNVTLLSIGTCSFTASRAADSVYLAAVPVTRTLQVMLPNSSYPRTIVINNPFSYAGLGTLSFPFFWEVATSENPAVCSIPAPSVVLANAPGNCVITIAFPGNSVFAPAPSQTISFPVIAQIPPPGQTISIVAIGNKILGDPSFPVIAMANSGLPVTLTTTSPQVCSLSGDMVTLLGAGTCRISASRSGDAFLNAASASVSFAVSPIARIAPAIQSIKNGASYAPGVLAPSSYGSIFGRNFLVSPVVTLHDANGADFTLEQNYTSDTQINILMPENVALGAATLAVTNASGTSQLPLTIAAIAPGIVSADATGSGPAAAVVQIVSEDRSVINYGVGLRAIPIAPNAEAYLILYTSGVRGHSPNGVSARIGGLPAEVLYAGPQAQYPGLDQVNLKLPSQTGSLGQAVVQLSVDGVDANPVLVYFEGTDPVRYTRSR